MPEQQWRIVERQIADMHAGRAPALFEVAAQALRTTGLRAPSLLDIGCGSGHYSEVLRFLVDGDLAYTGLDYSEAMLSEARRHFPGDKFVCGDALNLPFPDASFDVSFSSAVLLHVRDHLAAIAETARVSRSWCLFHRTPILYRAPTTWFEKLAYGVRVFEVYFNEDEFRGLLETCNLELVERIGIDEGSISGTASPGAMVTFVCRRR